MGQELSSQQPFANPFEQLQEVKYSAAALAFPGGWALLAQVMECVLSGNPQLTMGTSLLLAQDPGNLVERDEIQQGKQKLFAGMSHSWYAYAA